MFPIQLSTKNIPLEEDVKRVVNNKLSKLEKRVEKFPQDAVRAVVLIKKRVHRSDDPIYTASIAFYVPSRIFHTHQEGYTLVDSMIRGVEDIEDQLEKFKSKLGYRS